MIWGIANPFTDLIENYEATLLLECGFVGFNTFSHPFHVLNLRFSKKGS